MSLTTSALVGNGTPSPWKIATPLSLVQAPVHRAGQQACPMSTERSCHRGTWIARAVCGSDPGISADMAWCLWTGRMAQVARVWRAPF